MNNTVKQYYKKENDKKGLPQEYKGVLFYPIRIDDEQLYEIMSSLLTYNQMSIANKEILKMSYLKFMLHVMQSQEYNKDVQILDKLKELLKYITRCNCLEILYMSHFDTWNDIKNMNDFRIIIKIKDKQFDENDFNNIREIILEQNDISIDYVNEFDPTLEESLIIFYKSFESATFEEQQFSFCAYMKILITSVEFKSLTFYQFKKHMERIHLLLNYELLHPLVSSGQISFKTGKLESWISHIPNKSRYSDILIEKGKFEKDNEIFQVSKQI
jgi:hypothetical protein